MFPTKLHFFNVFENSPHKLHFISYFQKHKSINCQLDKKNLCLFRVRFLSFT